MIIFENYKFLEKLVGFHPHFHNRNIVLRTIYLTTLFSFNLMESIFIVVNSRDNPIQAVTALGMICGVLPAMWSYAYLLMNRNSYYSLFGEMQSIVDESRYNNTLITSRRVFQRQIFRNDMHWSQVDLQTSWGKSDICDEKSN